MGNWLVDHTVSWLDPVGAHSDINYPEVYEMLWQLMHH
jgi:hypothetical protein